jgi:hypothetical protein
MAVKDGLAARHTTIERRGWAYLVSSVAAAIVAGFIAPVLAYVVLAAAAAGAWITGQQAVVRWALTVLALGLVVGLVLGLSAGGVGQGSAGGPITRQP